MWEKIRNPNTEIRPSYRGRLQNIIFAYATLHPKYYILKKETNN